MDSGSDVGDEDMMGASDVDGSSLSSASLKWAGKGQAQAATRAVTLHIGALSARVLLLPPDVPDDEEGAEGHAGPPETLAESAVVDLPSGSGDAAGARIQMTVLGVVPEPAVWASAICVSGHMLVQFDDSEEDAAVVARSAALASAAAAAGPDEVFADLSATGPASALGAIGLAAAAATAGAGGDAGARRGGGGSTARAANSMPLTAAERAENDANPDALYCCCKERDENDRLMIECSFGRACNGWVHPDCFGMDEDDVAKAVKTKRWACALCVHVRDGVRPAPKQAATSTARDVLELLHASLAQDDLVALVRCGTFGQLGVLFRRKTMSGKSLMLYAALDDPRCALQDLVVAWVPPPRDAAGWVGADDRVALQEAWSNITTLCKQLPKRAAELKFACDRMDELASVLNLPGIASELHALFGRELSERSERKAKGRGGGTTRQKEKAGGFYEASKAALEELIARYSAAASTA